MGLSLLVLFSQIHLSLGRTSIILAHITFCLSFVVITVGARLDGLKQEYEEAAGDLYARPWQGVPHHAGNHCGRAHRFHTVHR